MKSEMRHPNGVITNIARYVEEFKEAIGMSHQLWLPGFPRIMTLEQVLKRIVQMWKKYMVIYKFLSGNDSIEPTPAYAELLEKFKNTVKAFRGARILVLGCGPARELEGLLDIIGPDGRIVVTDIIFDLPEKITRDSRVKIIRLDFCEGFGALKNEVPFDIVLSNMSIVYTPCYKSKEHDDKYLIGLPAFKAMLGDIKSMLTKGGQFVFSSPVKNQKFGRIFLASIKHMVNVIGWIRDRNIRPITGAKILGYAQKISYFGKVGLFHLYDEIELRAILREVELTNVEITHAFCEQDFIVDVRNS